MPMCQKQNMFGRASTLSSSHSNIHTMNLPRKDKSFLTKNKIMSPQLLFDWCWLRSSWLGQRWEFIKENKKVRFLSRVLVLFLVFLFFWSLSRSSSCFLFFLIAFLVEFLFSCFLDRFLGRVLVFFFSWSQTFYPKSTSLGSLIIIEYLLRPSKNTGHL